ncbi:MAG: hypothetical protein PHQ12_12540 [Chthoniobacteraceae bacterium]|nr:hypothetical protein [Chthoniobacteraceae bacterium]
MKRTLALLLAAFVISTLPAAAQQSSILSQAQRAYVAGDVATAKPLFEQVLRDDPQNVAARNYLKAIALAEAQAGPGAKVEKQLQALILPKVEFKDATLDSVLEALKQQASKASNGKLVPNFVVQGSVNKSAPVTLHLENIPFMEVLRYIGGLVQADFTVDRYAILVKPKAGAAAAPVAQ